MWSIKDQALAALKKKWYTDEQINTWISNVKAQQDAWMSNSAIKSDIKSNTSKYFDTPSSTGGTVWWNSNTDAEDPYWDVKWWNKGVWPMDFSKSTWELDESSLKFWVNAHAEQAKNNKYLTWRNNDIAWYLYKQWIYDPDSDKLQGKVWEYLSKFKDFTDAEDWEQANTKRAIADRLSELKKQEEWTDEWIGSIKEWVWTYDAKDGYYYDSKGNYFKIYGYDDLSPEQQAKIDGMNESQKKQVSNLWASWMQDLAKYYLDSMRNADQLTHKQDIKQELHDIDMEQFAIQTWQQLRNAEEAYNNLQQNWQYLGNMWMPWVSSTKIKAIWDAIWEAKTQLNELNRLIGLQEDAKNTEWRWQVLNYTQQMENIAYDLKWKVWDEITWALSKYTTAELEWKLDTIDGITAFKRELLDELDNNLSWLTSASLSQMQYINQEYQNIADKALEYQKNANTVNTEMSAVKGFYVDGNGNPILNNMGQPIEIPPTAPMEPVFDKETGKLIQFALDENWQIVANVQQLWTNTNSEAALTQYWIVSMLEQWYSVWDILKQFPNANVKDIQALQEVVKQTMDKTGRSLTWQGGNYNAVNEETMLNAYKDFTSQYADIDKNGKFVLKDKDANWLWKKWWQCWHFVNNYLQDMWIGRLFTDPITDKMKNINSMEAKQWSIVIMDSPSKPEYWHVGIVTYVNPETWDMTIMQSNKNWEEKVFFSKKNINDADIYWFFDPTKSIQQYNNERSSEATWDTAWWSLNEYWYNSTKVWYYDKYLQGKFTTQDWKEIWDKNQFEKEVKWYQKYKDAQASDFSVNILAALYNLEDMWFKDYANATLWIPYTDGYKYKRYLDNLISNTTLQTLIDAKSKGATFWALSDTELNIIKDASTILDWKLDRDDFNAKVKQMIKDMEKWFINNWSEKLVNELKNQYKKWNKWNGWEIKYFTENWGNWWSISMTETEENIPNWWNDIESSWRWKR